MSGEERCLVALILLVLFCIWGAWFEHKHPELDDEYEYEEPEEEETEYEWQGFE